MAGVELRVASNKALALLAYLALRRGAPQGRATLASLLWEESAERDGRNSLSTALSLLRSALPVWPLRAESDALSWSPDAPVWLDALPTSRYLPRLPADHLC